MSENFHPLAWEIARNKMPHAQGDDPSSVEVAHELYHGEIVRGCGPTSTAAARSLAVKLTRWAECQEEMHG